MAVIQRASGVQADAPPLWLPRHDGDVVEQASARPSDVVDGYTAVNRLTVALGGSRWKMATAAATFVATLAFLALLPSLFGAGVATVIKLAFYQAWTVALLLLLSSRVRSISTGSVVRYWLAGMFTVAIVASFVSGPLSGLVESGATWITPPLEELLKAALLAVAVFMGRRAWRHPGLSDLMILGFAVGSGYAFHEEALWERGAASGIKPNAGLFVPSMFQPDGLLVVGQGVWAALIGFAIGLVILHRRQPLAVVAAVVTVLVVLGDRMSVNDVDGATDVVRQLLFNGKLTAVLFLAAVAAAVLLDQRRLSSTSVRDHLFPSDFSHAAIDDPDADVDPLKSILTSRYRRLRNGMHTTVGATTQHWPPRCEAHAAPIAELARLGRAADIAVGPGTSPSGWAPDPESPAGFRFVGPNGFTAYAAGNVVVDPAPPMHLPPEPDDADLDDETRARRDKEAAALASKAKRTAAIGPTSTSISTPKARVDAVGSPTQQSASDFLQYLGMGIVAVGLFCFIRIVTAGDASETILETPFSLGDAPNNPALIIGLIGALAAAVAIRGRNPAELNAGWEVGPGPDPSPNRTDECQA